jgi:hypothetical protein
MITTPELRSQFDKAFVKIVKSLPTELQRKWNGSILWKDEHSYPEIEPKLLRELPTPARAAYVTLLNKLSRGRI